MNERRLKIWRCPECGEQERAAGDWIHVTRDGSARHWHHNETRYFLAEEVECIPVSAPNVLSVDEAARVRHFGDHTTAVLKSEDDEKLLDRLSDWAGEER